jgi:hypothetical protein
MTNNSKKGVFIKIKNGKVKKDKNYSGGI